MDASLGSLENSLAEIIARLLKDEISPKIAVEQSESLFQAMSRTFCEESQQFLCRPARRMHLLAMSEEMDHHSATWHLLWCLYCSDSPHIGTGGPMVTQTGNHRTLRQALTDHVVCDKQLSRVASVVTWLESLADDMLTRSEDGNRGPSFASKEGLWASTFVRSGYEQHISEMDPDAPTRQNKSLHPDNAKAEARLMQRLWQLVRAGRVAEACELCVQVGQPWRAASLGGCGAWGPLPVGVAAAALDACMSEAEASQELACEVEGGMRAAREMWKLTCQAVAAQASESMLGGDFEAAVYGAMCGSLRYMMPVCSSWEDGCWMLCRSWLQERCDELASQLDAGVDRETAELEMASSHVIKALIRCGAGASITQAAVQEVAVVMGRGGDPARQSAGQAIGAYRVPKKFEEVFIALDTSPVPQVSASAASRLRQTQRFLIEDGMHPLTLHLYDWLVIGGGQNSGSSPDASSDPMQTNERGSRGDNVGLDGDSSTAAGSLPAPQQRFTAVSAHLLLLLEALGVLTRGRAEEDGRESAGGMQETEADLLESNRISATSQQLVALHAATLLERGQLLLVPQYLCHLRDGLREALAMELLAQCSKPFTGACSAEQLSQTSQDCTDLYCSLSEWFSVCFSRQQCATKDHSSFLHTDIRNDELQHRLLQFMGSARFSPSYGADARVQLVQWLLCPCVSVVEEHMQRGKQDEPYELDMSHVVSFLNALEHLNALSCELALGNESTAEAGHALYQQVVPNGFETAASEVADALSAASSREGIDSRQQEAEQALFRQMKVLTLGVNQWRVYFELDRDAAAWTTQCEALQQGGMMGVEDVVQQGTALLESTMQLLRCGWMGIPAYSALTHSRPALELCKMELTFTAPSTAAPDVAQGRGTAAAANGAAHIQSGSISAPQARRGEAGASQGLSLVSSRARDAAVPRQSANRSYPLLQGAQLLTALQEMKLALAAELIGRSDLHAVVVEPVGAAQGVVVVRIVCRSEHKMLQRAIALASSLVQGTISGQPDLLLINLRAASATAAAISMQCCLSQAVLRCAALRMELVTLRADASIGSDLVELLAGYNSQYDSPAARGRTDPASSPEETHPDCCLLDMLAPAVLQQVLRLEADTQVAAMQNMQEGKFLQIMN